MALIKVLRSFNKKKNNLPWNLPFPKKEYLDLIRTIAGNEDFNKCTRLYQLLGYSSFEEMTIRNYKTMVKIQNGECTLYELEMYLRYEELKNNKIPNVEGWEKIFRLIWIKMLLPVQDRIIAKLTHANLFVLNNKQDVVDMIDGQKIILAFREASGENIKRKDLDVLRGLEKMNELMPWPIKVLPTITLYPDKQPLIEKLSIILEKRSFLQGKECFYAMFDPQIIEYNDRFEVEWKESNEALIFLFMYLIEKKIIRPEELRNLSMHLTYFMKDGVNIPYDSAKTAKSRVPNKKTLMDFATSSGKAYLKLFYIVETLN